MSFPVHTFFTRTQLEKLDRQFAHLFATKLFNLLKLARQDEVFQRVFRLWKTYPSDVTPVPRRFRVSMGAEAVRFNEKFIMDIMYLDGKPVLHVVDEGTRFFAARFPDDASTQTIWETFLECRASMYSGLPHTILVDRGYSFGPIFANNHRYVSKKCDDAYRISCGKRPDRKGNGKFSSSREQRICVISNRSPSQTSFYTYRKGTASQQMKMRAIDGAAQPRSASAFSSAQKCLYLVRNSFGGG